jgi:hypothetical protein
MPQHWLMPLRLRKVWSTVRHRSAWLRQSKIGHHVLRHAFAEVILFPSFNELPIRNLSSHNLFLPSIGIISLSRSKDMSAEHVLKIQYEHIPCMMIVEGLISRVDVDLCVNIGGRVAGSERTTITSTVGTSVNMAHNAEMRR